MKFRNSYLWMFTVASLAGLGEVRGQFPAEQTPAGQTDTIRIMTYNIHHGEGVDGVYDVERIGRFMREQKVDLVGLQEVERKFSQQSNFEDQPAILTALLDFHAYYAPNLKDSFGNLTLSRWEISKSRNVLLPDPDSEEQRGISIATIPVGDVTLTFLNTHLSWGSPRNQKLQFEMIRDMVRALPEPVIIVGDFNTVPSKEFFPILLEEGFVSSRLTLKLKQGYDDVLISETWKDHVVNGKIIKSKLSDHPAFWMDLRLSKDSTSKSD